MSVGALVPLLYLNPGERERERESKLLTRLAVTYPDSRAAQSAWRVVSAIPVRATSQTDPARAVPRSCALSGASQRWPGTPGKERRFVVSRVSKEPPRMRRERQVCCHSYWLSKLN